MWGTRLPFRMLSGLTFIALVASWPRPAMAGELKVLFATDERAKEVGLDMEHNRTSMEALLRSNVPKTRYAVSQVPVDSFSGSSILKAIDDLNIGPDDAILFYYSGHGALDPERNDSYFLASGDDENDHLYLSQLSEAIHPKQARLAVLVLDCCNNLRPVEGKQMRFFAQEPETQEVSPAFQQLFFEGQGTALIESSAPGEYALVEPQVWTRQSDGSYAKQSKGSLFTRFFREVLADRMRPANSWEQVCRRTQTLMDGRFRDLCPNGLVRLGTGKSYPQTKQSIVATINGKRIASR